MANNIFKKNPPPLAAPALAPAQDEPLSAIAGAFATRIERLEASLRDAEDYGRKENQRAETLDATLTALKKEFEHIRSGQEKEMNVLRNQCDHWHDEAVRLRSRIDAIVEPLLAVLRPPPPSAGTLAEPPPGLEEALASPPEGEFHE